ncbi:MAG: hypothetical protein QOJ85_1635 [Solirubrobacteraceae bacterium]|jgi:hypothetical protein|nr:hypothetical protein [Solirubrobacteraceae bacterium]MEA2245207.1 hypothetical protein [Solirubrobacteraceae bacterium]
MTTQQALKRSTQLGASPPAAAERSSRLLLLVTLSASAGVIHAKALFDHAGHYARQA